MTVSPEREMTVTALRSHLAEALRATRHGPITLTSHGRRAAVLVDAEIYDRLVQEWEDYQDILAYDEAKNEDDGVRIPWEDVKRDLGLE